MLARLKDATVTVIGHNITLKLTYPERFMAATAYSSIWECCERFNKEPDLNPDEDPRIYVFGEMYTPQNYLQKLAKTAQNAGAKIQLTSEDRH